MVPCDCQIEIGSRRILRTSPEKLDDLIRGEVGIIRSADGVSTLDECARRQRIIRVGVVNAFVRTIKLDGPNGVLCNQHKRGVIRNCRSDGPQPLGHARGIQRRDLRGTQRARGNGIVNLGTYGIERETQIIEADIALKGIARTCVYRKLMLGRNGDEARPGWRMN